MVERAARLLVAAALAVAGCTTPFAHVHAPGHGHSHAHEHGSAEHGPHWHLTPQAAAEMSDGAALAFDGDGHRPTAVSLSALAVETSLCVDPSTRALAVATWEPSDPSVWGPVVTVEATARSSPRPRYPLATRAPPV